MIKAKENRKEVSGGNINNGYKVRNNHDYVNCVVYIDKIKCSGSTFTGCSFRCDELTIDSDVDNKVVFKNCNFNCKDVNLEGHNALFQSCRIMANFRIKEIRPGILDNCKVRQFTIGGFHKFGYDYFVSLLNTPTLKEIDFSSFDEKESNIFFLTANSSNMNRAILEIFRLKENFNVDIYLHGRRIKFSHYEDELLFFEHIESGMEMVFLDWGNPILVSTTPLTIGQYNNVYDRSCFKSNELEKPLIIPTLSRAQEIADNFNLKLPDTVQAGFIHSMRSYSEAEKFGSKEIGIVKQFLPNNNGLYDVYGSVNEWFSNPVNGHIHIEFVRTQFFVRTVFSEHQGKHKCGVRLVCNL